jgi:hypothetical protein
MKLTSKLLSSCKAHVRKKVQSTMAMWSVFIFWIAPNLKKRNKKLSQYDTKKRCKDIHKIIYYNYLKLYWWVKKNKRSHIPLLTLLFEFTIHIFPLVHLYMCVCVCVGAHKVCDILDNFHEFIDINLWCTNDLII